LRLEFGTRPRHAGPQRAKGPAAWITQWLVNAIGLALLVRFVPGVELRVDGASEAMLAVLGASAVLGLLNLSVKPLLLIVTLPVTILTLGLFTLVINGLVLWTVAALLPAFHLDSFGTAVWAALCFSAFTLLLNALLGGATLTLRVDRRP
jgi:putative membrane protein